MNAASTSSAGTNNRLNKIEAHLEERDLPLGEILSRLAVAEEGAQELDLVKIEFLRARAYEQSGQLNDALVCCDTALLHQIGLHDKIMKGELLHFKGYILCRMAMKTMPKGKERVAALETSKTCLENACRLLAGHPKAEAAEWRLKQTRYHLKMNDPVAPRWRKLTIWCGGYKAA